MQSLIEGDVPQPRLSEKFLKVIAQLRSIENNLNQTAMRANYTGDIDKEFYKEENKFQKSDTRH